MKRDASPGGGKSQGTPAEPEAREARELREAELRRILIRSATLDRPSAASRRQALDATLRRLETSHPGSSHRSPWLVLLAAAVVGIVLLSVRFSGPWFSDGAERGPGLIRKEAAFVPAPRDDNAAKPGHTVGLIACPARSSPRGVGLSIDSFEDGDAQLELLDGRSGTWIFADDGTGRRTRTEPLSSSRVMHPTRMLARAASQYALHFSGPRLTLWGASVSSLLAPEKCYDVSAYGGVGFWTRGRGRIYLGMPILDVVPRSLGGTCERGCNNVHRVAVDLSPDWTYHVARWPDLLQMERGLPLEFDPHRVFSVEFTVFAQDTPFDAWIDDVSFVD
ncbi:MAG TPA: hypothetical protein VFQ61_05595 [Polyangiaceae bacterium]|nr:hypothetical protein [Polyangiaceae bacterium]